MKLRAIGLRFVIVFVFFHAVASFGPANAWAADGPVIENLIIRAFLTDRGVLDVEETLFVAFDGQPLSQDLTRGISGHYAKSGREKSKTGFVLLNATLDDQPTKTTIRRNPESLRLTLGARGATFTPGLHVFKLKYELINMIVFHPEQDTLIWRVLRESSCPVLKVAVDASLPNGEKGAASEFRLFSGQMEDLQEGEGLKADGGGRLSTTLPLDAGKSLTLYMSWDKGLVAEDFLSGAEWRAWDVAVLFLLSAYYVFVWFRYGRVPKQAPALPGTTPPEDLPPGLLRNLRDINADARMLTAEILNLAVRGYIHVLDDLTADEDRSVRQKGRRRSKHDIGKNTEEGPPEAAGTRYSSLERMMKRKYRLRLGPAAQDSSSLSATEKLLLHNLFHRDDAGEIVLDQSSAKRIRKAFHTLVRNFSARGKGFHFQNTGFWTGGLFIFEAYTAFVMFHVLSRGVGGVEPDSTHALAFMAPLFLLAPFLGGEKIWREKMWKESTLTFIVRTCVPLFFCASALAILRQQHASLSGIAPLVGGIAVIGIFWKLMPVHSEEGVRLLNKIEGFQLGLDSQALLKEQDTVERFEALFPYACALDREQALIARYAPLITRLRHRARWHTADTRGFTSFNGSAEYFSLTYELGEAIRSILSG
ncbi:MAG: DUF2207 domain-containing protein [Synergistaceae bacterium]|jgi:hypothetical protein|nr:DUF2207 domain-containing protein [Synergistaceae bacterium]